MVRPVFTDIAIPAQPTPLYTGVVIAIHLSVPQPPPLVKCREWLRMLLLLHAIISGNCQHTLIVIHLCGSVKTELKTMCYVVSLLVTMLLLQSYSELKRKSNQL